MERYENLTGKKFGKLTAIAYNGKRGRKSYWVCQCECGGLKEVRADSLKAGKIQSCGCLKREQDKINLDRATHAMSHKRLYEIWQGMKSRCYNPNDARYANYGGRGIMICQAWQNDFLAFYNWAIAHGYSDTLTIDRIDNDRGYSPENCRFASNKDQCRNRSTNINIRIGNATKTLTEWCEIFKLDYKTVHARFYRNNAISLSDLFKC